MEKRALIAVVLSLLVLVLYQEWVRRQYETAPEPAKTAQGEGAPLAPAPRKAQPALQQDRTTETPVVPKPVEQQAKEVRVDTENYRALFTSRGARLKSFKFKRYRASIGENSPLFEMLPSIPEVPFPLGVQWQGAGPIDDTTLIYSVQGNNLKLNGDSQGTLVFQGQTPDGMIVTKKFTFTGSSYPIQLAVSVKGADGGARPAELLLTAKSDHSKPNHDALFEGLLALVDNKIKRESLEQIQEGLEFSGDVSWAGFGYTYFLLTVVPENGAGHKLAARQSGPALIASIRGEPGQSADIGRYTVYIGPKQLDILESLGKNLEKSIDFGYFGFISVPFLYVVHFFHGFTASYGIDIILLTIMLKLLMAPLTHKSFVSMKQMQKLQPQMERIKEKFKNDKEKLNKEIMELYRRNKVNPLGGCLPMLLQFPVFIGLYNALSTPIELRHAPFLWIKDLSRPDWESLPFTLGDWHLGIPVLTLLMGASMFLQQWMTPTAGDPNQRRMMLMMPVVFTAMFVTFPAGLTIYWLVNNVLTIGQQYWISRADR
jgi:YidC/Oxa1 family membrane protein insertase